MNWDLINARKREEQENPDTSLDFSKYELKKPKRINPIYELRKEISQLVDKPVLQICNQTKGFSEQQLKGIISDAKNDAIKFKISAGARCWTIIKEIRSKNKNGRTICKI